MRALCISRMSFSVSPLFSAQRGTVKPYGDRIHGDRILVTIVLIIVCDNALAYRPRRAYWAAKRRATFEVDALGVGASLPASHRATAARGMTVRRPMRTTSNSPRSISRHTDRTLMASFAANSPTPIKPASTSDSILYPFCFAFPPMSLFFAIRITLRRFAPVDDALCSHFSATFPFENTWLSVVLKVLNPPPPPLNLSHAVHSRETIRKMLGSDR